MYAFNPIAKATDNRPQVVSKIYNPFNPIPNSVVSSSGYGGLQNAEHQKNAPLAAPTIFGVNTHFIALAVILTVVGAWSWKR